MGDGGGAQGRCERGGEICMTNDHSEIRWGSAGGVVMHGKWPLQEKFACQLACKKLARAQCIAAKSRRLVARLKHSNSL